MAAAKTFTLTLSPNPSRNKTVVEVLDQAGIDYRVVESGKTAATRKAQASSKAATLPQLTCGRDVLDNFTKRSIVDFLWAHGAQFEDS